MIDFVKIFVKVNEIHDFLNKMGDPIQKVNRNTGELEEVYEVKVNNLTFIGYKKGTIKIMGSLHKYYNNGIHNHDDFHFRNLVKTLHQVFDRFETPFEHFLIKNIEFGVNISPPVSADSLVSSLVLHKRSMFKDVSLRPGNYRQVEYKQYFIKAYDKGIQNKLLYQVFRFEIKVRTMQLIYKYNIRTLQDLMDNDKLKRIGPLLAYHWEKVLLIDPTLNLSNLNGGEFSKHLLWSNPNYWQGIINNPGCKNKLTNQKKSFKNQIKVHSRHIHPIIKELIISKWDELLSS